jgi:hypothetical protein
MAPGESEKIEEEHVAAGMRPAGEQLRVSLRGGHAPPRPARADALTADLGSSGRAPIGGPKAGSGHWGLAAQLVPSADAVDAAVAAAASRGSRDGRGGRAWAAQRAGWWANVAAGLAGLQAGRHTAPAADLAAPVAAAGRARGRGRQRSGVPGRRRSLLMDTFGDSLIFVNQLYNAQFGTPDAMRKVPAHMPHFIDAHVMRQLQATFPDQWDATSTHRFRSPTDMQYGFSYFYFLQNQVISLLAGAS